MKKKLFNFSIFVSVLIAISGCKAVTPSVSAPAIDKLPEITLRVPDNPSEIQYLGLKVKGDFKIPDISAKVVIIELFSLYCPHCQKEAPNINELFTLIESKPKLADKIKMIGIGVGNSSFEAGVFKEKYGVGFPLFQDGDYAIHKSFGEVRTPFIVVLRLNDDGSHKVIYAKLGSIGNAKDFLRLIKKLAGL